MIPVYQAGRQLIKVRGLVTLSLLILPPCLWWGFDLARMYGVREGDGGLPAPLSQRLVWGGLVALTGIAFAAGMWQYARLYAARIAFDLDSLQIHLEFAGFFGSNRHVFNLADVGSVRFHRDVSRGELGNIVGHPTPTVDAPWMSIRVVGRRLPFIVDGQGEVLDAKLLRTLCRGIGKKPPDLARQHR